MTAVQGVLSAAERSVRSVFVGNIPYEATEEQLKDIFSEVGPVVSFRLVYDRETGKPKGYGFCEYKDQETALSAMRNLNAFDLNGRPLRVDNAASEKSKEELKNLQASLGGPPIESPYGTEVEPERAPEAISKAVASLPPEQMFELMKQMKVALSILHRQNPNLAPLGTGAQQPLGGTQPAVVAAPGPMVTGAGPMVGAAGGPMVAGAGPMVGGAGPMVGAAGPMVGAGGPLLGGAGGPQPLAPQPPLGPQGMGPQALGPQPMGQPLGQQPGGLGPLGGPAGGPGFPADSAFSDSGFGAPARASLLGERPSAPDPIRSNPFDPRVMGPMGPGRGGPDPRLDPRGDPLAPQAAPETTRAWQALRLEDALVPPAPAPNPVISAQDQEKAALIMQVLQLSDQQIALLPPDQRQSIMVLKEQIARSTQQQ
ncbi:hypothetical protein MTO96_010830 [Rhipicephalus appendiculatus]